MDKIIRVGEKEREYVQKVLDSQFSASSGCNMGSKLEKLFAEKFDANYAISFCNGTATLHACLEAAGVGYGDEVIVPPLTMSATTFAVLHANAIPVFADVDMESFVITAEAIEKCITPKTKAIITVALFGLSPDMDPIMALAKKHNLVVIEDNAQCFLSEYKGRKVGTLGDMSSYSFQSSKHLSSGEGGMVLTNNIEYADAVRRVSSLGYAGVSVKRGKILKTDIQSPNYFRHVSMGWNYRMSELCAAVMLAQTERIEELVNQRIKVAEMYEEVIKDVAWLRPQKKFKDNTNSYWSYSVVLERDDITWFDFRDKYMELGGDGIYAAWQLTYLEPMFTERKLLGREKIIEDAGKYNYERGICPNAEYLQPRMLQFKTNYWDPARAEKQMEVLKQTIAFFDKK